MLWVIAGIAIFVSSIILATFNFFQVSSSNRLTHLYGIFVIQNLSVFNPILLKQILEKSLNNNLQITFEVLLKGTDKVLTFVGPKWLIESFPTLKTIEVEDYISPFKSLEVSRLKFSNNSKSISPNFSKSVFIAPPEPSQVFWQLVLKPHSPQTFLASIALAIHSGNEQSKYQLKTTISKLIQENSTLTPFSPPLNNKDNHQFFKQREFQKLLEAGQELTTTDVDRLLLGPI